MNRWNFRVWIGAGLVVLGLLMLLERFGLFSGVTHIFWGLAFLAAAGWFLYRFAKNPRSEWWAAIPGFALAGLGAESLLPEAMGNWGGFFFLGALGLGFFGVYLNDRLRWWAIIPGGVLVTLACITVLDNFVSGDGTGGFLFIGLGLTFVLVATLANMKWAWIPGGILLAMGVLLGASLLGGANYIWPLALIAGGVLLIVQFVRRSR
jgi:hypothetical protein